MADVRVNLAFTADTKRAQASIQQLQQSLQQISMSGMKGTMTKEMEQASAAAKELSYHLNQAFNAKTGNFDLSRLDRSLKTSGTNIDVLSSKLLGAGATGQQAFIQLAQSIAAAERPMITLSSRMTGLMTTLKNTAKWQISSTILHGFMGAVQQAYGYAQDLNESLNNIRIVTGYNTDRMAQFAEEANKAAKALSTTTTAYTDASLIYYQQGLGDKEVKERTDVTVKLANVSRQSAEEVSSQMTAIWNNFDDGSKSLEYYGDAITALGAKTASSSAEIAEGLQKFAAVSDTVGLSYEYATAALATVVAQTRQSADTVGTAFKTLFARIEGLKLGETLEDGTTFNQYSEALAKIGVNIKDTNGELRNMDDILDDMGAKWKELSRDEQVAVAQKVAGVRQYQQMIALMDNYDTFQENILVAGDSEGTLQKQADIYAESWEAASKRVKASAQSLYSDLIDDDFFIKLNDGLSKLLDSIDAFIDGFGGIGPLILGIGSIMLGVFAHKIPVAINNLKASFNILFRGAANEARELANSMAKVSESFLNSDGAVGLSEANKNILDNTIKLTAAKDRLSKVSAKMNDQERAAANTELSLIEAQQKEIVTLSEKVDKRRELIRELQDSFDVEKAVSAAGLDDDQEEINLINQKKEALAAFRESSVSSNWEAYSAASQALEEHRNKVQQTQTAYIEYTKALYNSYVQQMSSTTEDERKKAAIIDLSQAFEGYINKLDEVANQEQGGMNWVNNLNEAKKSLIDLQDELSGIVGTNLPELDRGFEKAYETIHNIFGHKATTNDLKNSIEEIKKALSQVNMPAEQLEKILNKLGQGVNLKKLKTEFKTLGQEMEDLKNKQAQVNKLLGAFNPEHQVSGIERMANAASGLGSLAMGISSVRSAINALNNEDLSFGEKLTTVLMSVSMLAGSLRGSLTGLNAAFGGIGTMAGEMALALNSVNNIMKNTEVVTMLAGAATAVKNKEDKEMIANSLAKAAVAKGVITAEEEQAFATSALTALKKLDNNASEEQIAMALKDMMQSFLNTKAKAGETAGRLGHVAALYAEAAAAMAANTALSPLLALTILFIATLAGVALAIVGVVAVFKALSDAYNADAIAAQKAREVANELAETYDNCKQHYQDMISAMSEYKEARKSLEELKKGTDEYKEALQKANRAAQELITNNPSLLKPGDYKFENGELTITDKALDRVKQASEKSETTSYAASQIGNAKASIAEAKSLITDTVREVSKESSKTSMFLFEDELVKVIDKIADENLATTMSSKELLAQQLEVDSNSLYIDALWENREALEKCAKASLDASNQYEFATQAAVQELLSFNEKVANSDRGEEITNSIAESSEQYYDAAYQKLIKEGWGTEGISKASGANAEAKEVFAEYAKAANIQGATLVDTKGTDNNRQFVYTTAEGDEKKVSLEAMLSAMATANANKQMDNIATALSDALLPLDNYLESIESKAGTDSGYQTSAAITKAVEDSLLKKDFSNLSNQDALNLQSYLDNTEGGTEALLKSIFGEDLESAAVTYGYDSAQAWIDSFNEALKNADANWKELLKGLPEAIQEMAGSNTASAETLTNLRDTYNSAEQVAEGNGQQVMENINSVVSTMDVADQAAALEALSNVDWSNWDAIEQAKESMHNLGLDSDVTLEKLNKMADSMRDLNGAARDLDDLNLELDSDIDADEYKALAEHLQSVAEASDELSSSLKYNEKEAQRVSAAILRFDKAIEKVNKNYEDWSKTMKSGSLQDQAKMATELKDAYADMLDIDIRSLSNDFVMNADNLELMKQAAEGSEEAYNQLQAAVQKDILAHCDIDTEDFNAAKEALDIALAELDFENIEIGADLNTDEALTAMTDLVNAAHMTQQQATDYLASMGVDAEVETVKVPKPSTTETVDIVATEVPGTATVPVVAVDGTVESTTVPIPTIKYEGVKHETEAESEETATSLKVTSAHKSSGGGFKHKNSNLGGGSGGSKGKSCFIAGTLVSLGTIFKNIEDIKIGDIVLSYNEQTKRNEYSEVLQTMIHVVNEEIYNLYIEDEVLSVTGIHKFLIKRNNYYDWIPASELQINDQVFFADGTWHFVNEIKINLQFTTVYNFEVANNHNYYVGKNQILAHNKGGGGGGGGKSNPAEKKDYTKKTDVVDRYKQINDKLNVVNKSLDKYNKLSDLAYGKNKLKNMDKILNAKKQEIKLQQQLAQAAKNYLPEDRQNMEEAAAQLGVSNFKYDKSGNIKNIESIQEEIYVKIHAAEDEYNNFETKEQQEEYNKTTLEPLMKQYEQLKDFIAQYESTLNQVLDAEAAALDAQISYMDTKLEKISHKRQQRIEIRNTEISLFERELEKLENQAFATGRRVAYLTGELKALEDQGKTQLKNVKSNLLNGIYLTDEDGNFKTNKNGTIKTLNDTKYKNYDLDKILSKISDPNFWNTHELNEKYADSLKETLESLMDLDRSFDALKEKIDGEILSTFERWQKVMDRYTKLMDHYVNTANTWLDIINAVGKKNLGWDSKQMQQYRQQNWNVRKNQAEADYEKYTTSLAEFKSAKEGYAAIKSDKKKEANSYAKEEEAHKEQAEKYEKKYNKIYGSYYTESIEKDRAERKEIADKLKNPEKYYGDKDYFKTEKGKKKKQELEERDAKLKDRINKNKDAYEDTIEHKRAVREKIAIKLKQEQAKLDKARAEMDVKAAEAAAKEIDRLEKKDALYKQQIIDLKKQANEYKNLAETEHELANRAKVIQSEIEAIDQELDTMRETVRENREQIYQDLLDLIELSKENVSAYLDDVLKDFEKKVSGAYDSISQMQEAFDQNKTIADRYLQDTEKIYELTKMNRDLEKKMDETTNLKAKEKLAQFQEQILKYAKEGVKMSEYDLEIMQKQYDLEVAKIALEEAQNNKTQVRLTRDADGNYSYTYTADENKTADAEQNYEDKLNDLIKYNNEYQLQMQEAILNTEKAEADAIARLTEMWENNEITYDEFVSRATQAHAYYHSQLQYYAQENEKASENSMNAFVQEYDAYYTNTDKKIHVTQVFSDETRKTYEQVHQIYQDAAIARDQALYEEEEKYKTFQLEMARRLKEGEITQQEYDEIMEIRAKQHSDNLDAINQDYTKAVNKEVTLQNGTRLSASEYFRSLITGDQTTNSEVIAGMEASNKGFILNTETEYLPGLGNIYTQATKTVENFANEVTDGQGDKDGKTLLGQIKQGMQDHEANVAAAEEAIGIILSDEGDAYSDLATEAKDHMDDMENKSDELAGKVGAAGQSAREDMDLTVEKVKKWYTDSKPYLNKMKKKIDKVTTAITEMLAAAAGIKPITVEANTDEAVKNLKKLRKEYEKIQDLQNTTPTPQTVTPTTVTPPLNKGSQVALKTGTKLAVSSTSKQNVTPASWVDTQHLYVQSEANGMVHLGTSKDGINNSNTWIGWVKKSDIVGYDTGGYTGKWGSDGRWALLHEKELVLNKQDTENMLAAIKTVREIAAMVDLQAQNASLASQYALAVGSVQDINNSGIDQNVHITAEFPNVQDHNEVELALTSLVNRASQFAWRQ